MIAIALACRPKLLIADEATTALDVTTQAQIMELLLELQAELGMTLMLISHDLGLARSCADEVIVMYAGQIVEQASTPQLFTHVRMPYTRGPVRGDPAAGAAGALAAAGDRRQAARPVRAARLAARSRRAAAAPPTTAGPTAPPLAEHEPGHRWACWHPCGNALRGVAPRERRPTDGHSAAGGARPGPGVRGPGLRRGQRRRRARGFRRVVQRVAGGDARHRRRDRIRQVDAGQVRAPGAPAQGGRGHLPRRRPGHAARHAGCSRPGGTCRWCSRTRSARSTRNGRCGTWSPNR